MTDYEHLTRRIIARIEKNITPPTETQKPQTKAATR
jgi:hypothetical protein